jgi:acyl-CoA synthetase (NDP forming)
VVVIQTLQTMTDNLGDARLVARMHQKYRKPTLAAFMGGVISEDGIRYLESHGIPNFFDVKLVAYALKALLDYGRYLETVEAEAE